MSSSTYTINKFIQNTASFLNGNAVSDNIVSTSITGSLTGSVSGSLYGTASWAMNVVNGGTGGTSVATLTTGQLYHITSSWAETASLAKTASLANYALDFPFPKVVAAVSFVGKNEQTLNLAQYISSSYNVTFVSRTGIGLYKIYFGIPITGAYYVLGTNFSDSVDGVARPAVINIVEKSSSYVKISNIRTEIHDNGDRIPAYIDSSMIDVMIFKNSAPSTIYNDPNQRMSYDWNGDSGDINGILNCKTSIISSIDSSNITSDGGVDLVLLLKYILNRTLPNITDKSSETKSFSNVYTITYERLYSIFNAYNTIKGELAYTIKISGGNKIAVGIINWENISEEAHTNMSMTTQISLFQ